MSPGKMLPPARLRHSPKVMYFPHGVLNHCWPMPKNNCANLFITACMRTYHANIYRSGCGKFVGWKVCRSRRRSSRRGKFINVLHFGAELWENELVWRTGVQKIIYLCTLYNRISNVYSICAVSL